MDKENRTNIRYKDIGHIIAPEICVLPGIIDDISLSGCKVHYQFPVVIDLENEYEVKLSPSQNPSENPLNLMCTPQWVKEVDGKTYVGFQIQYSPDASRLQEFISHMEKLSDDDLPEII